jgi:phospholipid/cholesterol/gamma-HCH transport system substrate-binding protein
MKRQYIEITVGLFVLIGIACIGYLTIRLGKLEVFNSHEFILKAKFRTVAGLKKDGRIEIAGIEVGRISSMQLEPDKLDAIIVMKIRDDIKLSDDTIASIKTSGLIGDKFLNLSPGGSETYLKNGSFITETQEPLDIEELVGKFVFGKVDK